MRDIEFEDKSLVSQAGSLVRLNLWENLELAVLALARIMCAYIHSQNGSAILAQA